MKVVKKLVSSYIVCQGEGLPLWLRLNVILIDSRDWFYPSLFASPWVDKPPSLDDLEHLVIVDPGVWDI